MVPEELRKLRLAFVDSLDVPSLGVDDISHFRRVLRMVPGDALNVSDGNGAWRRVRLGNDGSELVPDGGIHRTVAQPTQVTVAFAPTKGDRPEWTIQKLSELGVGRIVAIQTQRSVVRWNAERGHKQLIKWQKVAREAAMQSRRLFLPQIEPQISIEDFVQQTPSAVLCEPGGRRFDVVADHAVVIGPEGGFTDEELILADHVDLQVGTIMRTETAALVAATLLLTGS